MRASSEGFLPNTRSHRKGVQKKARCVVVQLAIRFKRKRKRKKKFGVRLGILSRRKHYRNVLGVSLGILSFS